jgi:L-phenylalanine/L-methionine N-acetyltransferase
MQGIVIRAAEPDDAQRVFEIAQCPRVREGTLQMPYQTLAETEERLLEAREGSYHLVAEVNGEVVGMAGLHHERNPRRRHVGQIGMMVHDEFQGRGVGTALLNGLLDLADNWLNLHRIELEVYVDNVAGIHLYKSRGFVIEGTRPDFAFRNGRYVDAYVMGRVRASGFTGTPEDSETSIV